MHRLVEQLLRIKHGYCERVARALHKRLSPGIYVRYLKPLIAWLYKNFTFYKPLTDAVDIIVRDNATWVGELWQIFWIFVALGLLAFAGEVSAFFWVVIPVLSYRLYELILFLLHWMFIEKEPPYSTRRSLVSFLLIAFEMVILFGAAYSSRGCYSTHPGRLWAIYNALTTFVTIGPRNNENVDIPFCLSLGIVEIVIAYSLSILIIGTVASAVIATRINPKAR